MPIPLTVATATPTHAPVIAQRRTPTPRPAPAPAPAATAKHVALKEGTAPVSAAARDRALSLIGGSWSCATGSGHTAKHVYTKSGDGSIKLHNELVIANKVFAIDEVYRFDMVKDQWYTVTQGDAYSGTAPPWRQTDWVFVGSVPHGKSRVPVRMVYGSLGPNAFERAFQRDDSGSWKTFTTETCRRH